jgi:hypothetical protein
VISFYLLVLRVHDFLLHNPCPQIKNVIDREGSQDVTGTYNGVALAPSVTPCGTNWTTLEVMLQLPLANATVNGTALQLQLVAPQTERGWGASIWIGAASIVAA